MKDRFWKKLARKETAEELEKRIDEIEKSLSKLAITVRLARGTVTYEERYTVADVLQMLLDYLGIEIQDNPATIKLVKKERK